MEFTLATPVRHNMRALTVRPASPFLTRSSNRRAAHSAVVRAAQGDAQEQKVAQKVMLSAASAFAAVSLALTGAAGPVSAITLPRNAAPDLSLSKDDELFGKAFQKAGVPGNAPETGDKLKEKVADAPNEAKDAARKVQNAAPDLSLGKDDELLGKAFQKAGVPGNAPETGNKLKEKIDNAPKELEKEAERPKPNLSRPE